MSSEGTRASSLLLLQSVFSYCLVIKNIYFFPEGKDAPDPSLFLPKTSFSLKMETQDAGGQTALARGPLGGCRGRPPCWAASQRVWGRRAAQHRSRTAAGLAARPAVRTGRQTRAWEKVRSHQTLLRGGHPRLRAWPDRRRRAGDRRERRRLAGPELSPRTRLRTRPPGRAAWEPEPEPGAVGGAAPGYTRGCPGPREPPGT